MNCFAHVSQTATYVARRPRVGVPPCALAFRVAHLRRRCRKSGSLPAGSATESGIQRVNHAHVPSKTRGRGIRDLGVARARGALKNLFRTVVYRTSYRTGQVDTLGSADRLESGGKVWFSNGFCALFDAPGRLVNRSIAGVTERSVRKDVAVLSTCPIQGLGAIEGVYAGRHFSMWGDVSYFPPGDALAASSSSSGVGDAFAGGTAHFAAHLLQNSFAGATCHKTVTDPADEERAG